MPIRVIDLFTCARPLRWEHDDEEYTYTIGGTGFLARYRQRHFLVTAKHCLVEKTPDGLEVAKDPNRLRVEIRLNSGVFGALQLVHKIEGNEHWKDLAFFEFDPNPDLNPDLASPEFLDMNYFEAIARGFATESIYAFRGYPTDFNVPDYEAKKLPCKSITMSGHWRGEWLKENCGAFHLDDNIETYSLTDTDGLSGSPVFELQPETCGVAYSFSGVIYWGVGHILRFIEAKVVFRALAKICA